MGYDVNEQWQSKLSEIELYLNTSTHASTNAIPYEVLYGFRPRMVLDSLAQQESFADSNGLVQSTLER